MRDGGVNLTAKKIAPAGLFREDGNGGALGDSAFKPWSLEAHRLPKQRVDADRQTLHLADVKDYAVFLDAAVTNQVPQQSTGPGRGHPVDHQVLFGDSSGGAARRFIIVQHGVQLRK